MLLCKTDEGYELNLAWLTSGRGLNDGFLKICDGIFFWEFSICVPEVNTICKEDDNRVF